MKKFSILPKLILIILFLNCCKESQKKAPPKIDPVFSAYIRSFTSGIVSSNANIILSFKDNVFGVKTGMEADASLFKFSPKLKGKAYWKSNRQIEFRPTNSIPSGKTIDISFKLNKVLNVPKNLSVFKFQISVIKQLISVDIEGTSVYDAENLSWQKINGTLSTSDIADDNKIEQILTAQQKGKSLSIKWLHNAEEKTHKFTIDSVYREMNQGKVEIEWNGKLIKSEDKDRLFVEIPSLRDFKVLSVKTTSCPEQYISVFFSDPLDTSQDIEGLIHLKNNKKIKLEVDGNEVKIYLKNPFYGSSVLIIENEIRNSSGYQLHEKYEYPISFSSLKPDVKLIGKGVIIPSSNKIIFPFKAVSLSAVQVKIVKIFEDNIPQFFQENHFNQTSQLKRVGRIVFNKEIPLTSDKTIDYGRWNTFGLDLAELINTELGAIYRVIITFKKKHSLYPCSKEDDNQNEDYNFNTVSNDDSWDGPYSYYYDDYEYDYNSDYKWSERNDPCKASYYMRGNHKIAKNVFVSDLGIIAKGGNSKSLFVAVTDLKTTKQQANVEIKIYNYQNRLIAKTTTNAKGIANIKLDAKPFLLIAKKGKQFGYLRLDDGSSLSLSMFNVKGNKTTKGVKGFIYGERGVWRPGDSLYVSFILEDKNKALPMNHPVVFELYTPENQLYLRKIKTKSVNGFYDFRTATKEKSPTGNWKAKVIVGGSIFTKSLRIETVKPNRLKINLDFNTKILKGNKKIKGELEIKWLHGAIAKNLKSEVKLNLSKTKFPNFQGYTFDDPTKLLDSKELTVFKGKVNNEGKAKLKVYISIGKSAPGMLKANFNTKVFEKGGDFSVDRTSLLYSPYKSYVGVKIPEGEGWNKSLYSNEKNLIPIVTVDENGKPIDRKNLIVEVYKLSWRWWWERSSEYELANYIKHNSSKRILKKKINTKDGKAMFEMDLKIRSWGRKLIRITDPVSGHSSGILFYTSYRGCWNNSGQDNPGGAEMLSFKTNKNKYQLGEKVTLTLPSAKQGKALISIESGSKVIASYWTNISKKKNKFTFVTTKKMSPNVYIHISFLQAHNQTKNDLPIRLYGIQQIEVENPKTHLKPIIEIPDVLEPEKEVNIRVKEINGHDMTYTLAIVDEGLLDLTKYNTPDAWHYFYAREALGVKTWDMYKYVMGAFSGELSGLMAIGGGDEDIKGKEAKKVNRFKPVVKFFGPIHLDASATNTHTFKMPNYIGSVKAMLVAGNNNGAYGRVDKKVPVRKALMVLATFPRVVSPGEIVKLPVTIFSMDEKIKKVKVKVQTNKFFDNKGQKEQSLTFNEMGEQMLYFNLNVKEDIGVGRIKILAESGNEKAEYNIELYVRVPNPRISDHINKVLENGESWNYNFKALGMKGTNSGMIEISAIPPLNLEKRLQYLLHYPHGCVEQTTSSVFPQLFLSTFLELDHKSKKEIEKNVKAGIERLATFQLSNGGMSYWPGEYDSPDEWGTSYAGHFMIEAKALGYSLPYGFLNKWINFQRNKANTWSIGTIRSNSYKYRDDQLQQAYRLYTLALVGKPAVGPMNRLRELSSLTDAAKWQLAAAYYLIGRSKTAKNLIEGLSLSPAKYSSYSYTYGSAVRDQAMILETLSLLGEKDKAYDVFKAIQTQLNSNSWYSTQTTAYALLAVSKLIGSVDSDKSYKFDLTLGKNNSKTISSKSPIYQQKIHFDKNLKSTLKIKNISGRTLFVKLYMEGIPLTGDQSNVENNLEMDIRYMDMNGTTINPKKIIQGKDFIAEIKIKHPGIREDYKNVSLTQIFPSGWEIHNLRMDDGESPYIKDKARYQDIRDDRVYSYFDINKREIKIYRVLLNASYLGKFYLPTVYCEAMYDNEINAHKAGMWVEVIKESETQPVQKSKKAVK